MTDLTMKQRRELCARERKFGDSVLTVLADGRIFFDYGPSLGSQTFDTPDDAVATLDTWTDDEIDRLVALLADRTKLRRFIKREKKLMKFLSVWESNQ